MNHPAMTDTTIRFDDGAAYERFMGVWSQLAGQAFLDWLALPSNRQWLDVGCGNGAFTELLIRQCAPQAVSGIDPSEAQLAYARTRSATRSAQFLQGDAMALPFAAASFDAAVMPLVVFFVPNPAKGVAEMVRVVRPGGSVSAYAWDMYGGGFPYDVVQAQMRELGMVIPAPPSPEASRLEVMHDLWTQAGLKLVETQAITVQRTFMNFDDYWATVLGGPSMGARLAAMSAQDIATLQARIRDRLSIDVSSGQVLCQARAHAVKGLVPA